MKLHYGDQSVSGRRCVLQRESDGRRVEISLHDHQDAETLSLIALSGNAESQPEKQRCMGPFHSLQQAQGAMNALANALIRDDFERIESDSIWQMVAARLARDIRECRARHATDTRFVPLGVPPEQPD